MKQIQLIRPAILFILLLSIQGLKAQNPENWTNKQLMEPPELAATLKKGKNLPVIICVGPGASIPNSIETGMTKDAANLDKLKQELATIPKNKKIVIYCGCCPFEKCPNVRPAIDVLKSMKFTNYKLLDLPHNLKTDWIDKGYPVK
jgi:hypothetical protein